MSTHAQRSIHEGTLKRLFPEAGPRLLELYLSAAENAALTDVDFMTLRDLQELSRYTNEEALHALLLSLVLALQEGSVCQELSLEALTRRLDGIVEAPDAAAWAERMLREAAPERFERLIGRDAATNLPVVLRESGGRRRLYFEKYLTHERTLEQCLHERLAQSAKSGDPALLKDVLDDVLTERALVFTKPSGAKATLELNNEQKIALGLALLRPFVVVCGGPGTGKTTLVFTLLRCLSRLGISPGRIALAAPTGRAAQRLTESLLNGLGALHAPLAPADQALHNLQAQTVHRLLDYHPGQGVFRQHRENCIAADVVIVDEVSMVDVVLMARLLEAVPPGAKVILLGDKDQLPSVDAGSVLADLTPADGRPQFSAHMRTRLTELLGNLRFTEPVLARPTDVSKSIAAAPAKKARSKNAPGQLSLFAALEEPEPGTASAPGILELPPSSSLSVCADAKSALTDHVVMLVENRRSQPQIRDLARAINEADASRAATHAPKRRRFDDGTTADSADPIQRLVADLPRLKLHAPDGTPTGWPRTETLIAPGSADAGGGWLISQRSDRPEGWYRVLDAWTRAHYAAAGPGGKSFLELAASTPAPGDVTAPAHAANLDALFAIVNGARILTLIREGPWGCVGINQRLGRVLSGSHRDGLFPGAPVIVTSNDHSLKLYNGDVGLALHGTSGGLQVVFQRRGADGQRQYLGFPVSALPGFELAYAITVHKSQGSEYDQVLIPLPPKGAQRLLNRQMIYTALTRAKQLAVFCGSPEILTDAVRRKLERSSGMTLASVS